MILPLGPCTTKGLFVHDTTSVFPLLLSYSCFEGNRGWATGVLGDIEGLHGNPLPAACARFWAAKDS